MYHVWVCMCGGGESVVHPLLLKKSESIDGWGPLV